MLSSFPISQAFDYAILIEARGPGLTGLLSRLPRPQRLS